MINKHSTLRTALRFSNDHLWQHVNPVGEGNFELKESLASSNEDFSALVAREETDRSFFKLEQGRVVRLHIVRHSINTNKDQLVPNDVVIISFIIQLSTVLQSSHSSLNLSMPIAIKS